MTSSNGTSVSDRPRQPERLPCGTRFDDLLDQVADDIPPSDPEHQASCPHCRATLAELADIWAPVRAVAQEPNPPPDTLTASVMERVVAIATHGWHAVLKDTPGVTRIAAWVVAVVARRAAAGVSGVGQVRGQISPSASAIADVKAEFDFAQPTPGQRTQASGIGVAGRRVVVSITISAGAGQPLPALAEEIRTAVTRHVQALTGLDVIEVDVHVADLDGPLDLEPS